MQGAATNNDASYDLGRGCASVTGRTTIAASAATIVRLEEAKKQDEAGRKTPRARRRAERKRKSAGARAPADAVV